MHIFEVKVNKLAGTSYSEVVKQARVIYNQIKHKTKRRPYLRSAYFNKEKIFFDYFWQHLSQKREKDKVRRLKYFSCAIELIKQSKNKPTSIINRNNKNEILYKFYGKHKKDGKLFYVQIKENRKTGKKCFMSCFSEK